MKNTFPTPTPRRLRRRTRCRPRRGATLVEFALTVGIAFMFFFAALEFSRVASMRHAVELALYEGARAGIIPGATANEVRDAAKSVLAVTGVQSPTIDVTPSVLDDTAKTITVRIRIPLDKGLFGPANFFKDKTLDRTLTMQREGNR